MAKRGTQGHEPPAEEPKSPHGERRHRDERHGRGHGTERAVYEQYLARKWDGSAPPSPQAYAQAIRLWRQLPGSIMTAPTDLGAIPESAPSADSKEPSQE
jgi:hypothetical protein